MEWFTINVNQIQLLLIMLNTHPLRKRKKLIVEYQHVIQFVWNGQY